MTQNRPQISNLDHIVVATPDLHEGVQQIAEATGVQLERGGSHPHWGTRNYLATFGDGSYFELISADPENTEFSGTRPFKVDEVEHTRAVTWAIEPPSVEAALAAAEEAGFDLGEPAPGSRHTAAGELLQWRLTPPIAGPSGIIPFLLDWSGSTTPAATLTPQLSLVDIKASHPEAARYTALLKSMGTDLEISQGPESLQFTLEGPAGRITL